MLFTARGHVGGIDFTPLFGRLRFLRRRGLRVTLVVALISPRLFTGTRGMLRTLLVSRLACGLFGRLRLLRIGTGMLLIARFLVACTGGIL